jgi:hypothetical protein
MFYFFVNKFEIKSVKFVTMVGVLYTRRDNELGWESCENYNIFYYRETPKNYILVQTNYKS